MPIMSRPFSLQQSRLCHALLYGMNTIHIYLYRRVPNYIVRIMMYWYANQTMCVRWSGIVSQGFHVTNGVRQGGILSPYLFNVYLDDLSIALSACRTGCCVGNSLINHLMYADDLVIFSPSSIGLRALITVCRGANSTALAVDLPLFS